MRYIGGKSLLLDHLMEIIRTNTDNVHSVIDIFAGSGAVSARLKEEDFSVVSNDMLYFSYVLNRGVLDIDTVPSFSSLGIANPIEYLNNLTIEDTNILLEDCFIYNNYSPNNCSDRMYFQGKNALKIDIVRLTIESWHTQGKITDDEYYYLLASLISAVPFVSNIAGVYGAYLKHWDIRTYNDLVLQEPALITQGTCKSYNMKDTDLLGITTADLLYADPPYNSRQYLPNYHVLETISRYDYPKIKGVTGMRDYSNQKSDFCKKATVHGAFENMIASANVKYVMISYNSEGLLSTEELTGICKKYAEEGSFKLIEIDYRRYKNKQVKTNHKVQEQVYFFQKKL